MCAGVRGGGASGGAQRIPEGGTVRWATRCWTPEAFTHLREPVARTEPGAALTWTGTVGDSGCRCKLTPRHGHTAEARVSLGRGLWGGGGLSREGGCGPGAVLPGELSEKRPGLLQGPVVGGWPAATSVPLSSVGPLATRAVWPQMKLGDSEALVQPRGCGRAIRGPESRAELVLRISHSHLPRFPAKRRAVLLALTHSHWECDSRSQPHGAVRCEVCPERVATRVGPCASGVRGGS